MRHLAASTCAENSDIGTSFKKTLHVIMIYFLYAAYYSEMLICLQKTSKIRSLHQVSKISINNI